MTNDDSMSQIWRVKDIRFNKTLEFHSQNELLDFIKSVHPSEHSFWRASSNTNGEEHSLDQFLMKDRRQHPRFEKQLRVRFVVSAADVTSSTIDVSLGGMKVCGQVPNRQPNSLLYLYPDMDPIEPFIMKYKVLEVANTWSRLEFQEESLETRVRFSSWLSSATCQDVDLNLRNQNALLIPTEKKL